MNTRSPLQTKPTSSFIPVSSRLLQRKCACGGSAGLTGKCSECENKRLTLQRRANSQSEPDEVPPIVHEVLNSSGKPLDSNTRAFMESRFGHDFASVKVHTDAKAAESAQAVNALAYTVGRDIVFGKGQYQPKTVGGKQLLAHELTHVVQQKGSNTTPTKVHRQEIANTLPTTATSPETSSVNAMLLSLIAQIEQIYSQTVQITPSDETPEKSSEIEKISGFVAQLRTVASGDDENLKLSILSAFSPRNLQDITENLGQFTIEESNISPVAVQVQQPKTLVRSSLAISHFQDAAELEAVKVADAVVRGNSVAINRTASPRTIHRDGGASAALAGLIAFEAAGGAEAEAATGPPGWVVGGVVLLAIAGLAIYVAATSETTTATQERTREQAEPIPIPREETRTRNCATEYPSTRRCDGLPSQFIYFSPQMALNALKATTGNQRLRLVSGRISTGGPCPGVGTHYGVKDGGTYVASISCCPCCQDTPNGPMMMTRCRII